MKSLRLASFALTALCTLAASGCRTAGLRDITRADVDAPPRPTRTAANLLVDHNRNARAVDSLEARPSVVFNNRRLTGALNGRLAFERQKNFNLTLSDPMKEVAYIGSNDQEFWFYVANADDPGIYFCNYDAQGASPLASSMQPDWVIEALGLKVVSDAEADQIEVSPGKDPGTIVLTHRAFKAQGQSFVREAVLSEATHRIREYRVLSGDRKTLIARATVSEYQELPVPPAADQAMTTVVLPKKVRLEWVQEKLTLDVVLKEAHVNTPFDETRRSTLFAEPERAGVARRNLAQMAGLATATAPAASSAAPAPAEEKASRTTVRQTMPAPPPRVRLVEPTPLGRRGGRPGRSAVEEDGRTASLPPYAIRGVEEVVGPPIPRVSDPAPSYIQANSGWRTALSPGLER